MELKSVNTLQVQSRQNLQKVQEAEIITSIDQVIIESSDENFMYANTEPVNLIELKEDCIIPSFAKDNESTISHTEFIESVSDVAHQVFSRETILNPAIRVSHPIKGRIPEAMGKPAKDLLEHEKTLYYERMAFIIEIPSIFETVHGNVNSLTIGGVRAYNQENLYSRKTEERFKVFIGFKNKVCTNLCVSTDGFLAELKVRTLNEMMQRVYELLSNYIICIENGVSDLNSYKYNIGRKIYLNGNPIYNQLIKYYNVDLADRTVIQELILIEKRIESQLNYRNLSLYPKEEVFSCDELIVFLKSNGEIIKKLSSYHLTSSWLNRVTGYIYEGNIYAIAEIKDSEWPYKIKSYIFCNISESNWSNFDNIYINGSYGERFHKFIFDYQCNCE